ncbi:hypothetical protein [Spirosoma sp.]|uniref:hypothetical protein n=1 Tax=Spirosoma sp. TaxID=1899569 RepID=UPI003B3ABBEA
MNQYCIAFILLVVKMTNTQAQSVSTLYAFNQPQGPAISKAAPTNPKAAEKPFYIKAYGYYSLLTPGTSINYDVIQTQISLPNSFKATRTNLGAGPRAGLGIGFILSDFINVGVDADLLLGKSVETNVNVFTGNSNTFTNYNITSTTTLNVLSIIPNITFKALSRPAYYIYNRLGLVGGIVLDYKQVNRTIQTPNRGAITTSESTSEYTNNSLAIGYQAALGVQFRLSQSIRAFAEIVAYNQSFKPREVQNTSMSTTSGKTTTSNSSVSYKDNGDYLATPTEFPTFNVAINSVGVGAGFLFRL